MSTTPNQPLLRPSIPPPTKKFKSCKPFSWSCNDCSYYLFFILLFLEITCILVSWVIFQRSTSKCHVNDATLTQFTLSTTNNTLYYDLALNMTLPNPYRRIGIYFDRIEANAVYHGERFDSKNLDTFYLGGKEEKDLGTVFRGQQVVVLGDGDRSKYDSERKDGVYNIDVKLRLRMMFKVWLLKKWDGDGTILVCELKVPLSSGGSVSSARFERTKCYRLHH